MKIIDLLNKIAKGEEVPKKLKYNGEVYNEDNMYLIYCALGERREKDFTPFLNDEVEIIEEEKKIPEKLSTWFSVETSQNREDNIEYANVNFKNMYDKINEICDYLKNRGDEKYIKKYIKDLIKADLVEKVGE